MKQRTATPRTFYYRLDNRESRWLNFGETFCLKQIGTDYWVSTGGEWKPAHVFPPEGLRPMQRTEPRAGDAPFNAEFPQTARYECPPDCDGRCHGIEQDCVYSYRDVLLAFVVVVTGCAIWAETVAGIVALVRGITQ